MLLRFRNLKSLAFFIAAVFFGIAARADMEIIFNNRVVGDVIAPISRPDGSGAGAGVRAQLFLVKSDGTLSPLSPGTTFRTSSTASAFFVNPVAVTISGIQLREKVTLRLRAWEGDDFATSPLRGESKDFQLTNNSAVNNLIGLKPFQLFEQKPSKR